MGNCLNMSSSPTTISEETSKPLPIEAMFKLPSPLPAWPPEVSSFELVEYSDGDSAGWKLDPKIAVLITGEGFGRGTIDLGGLELCEVSSFTKVWATHQGGPGNLGATFFEPSPIPDGFFMLGGYAQPNNRPLFGWVLAGKDVTNDPSGAGALKPPIDYTLVGSSESSKIKQDGSGYIWFPTPPDGYKAAGLVITNSPVKPPLDKIRCVLADFTDVYQTDEWIWGEDDEVKPNGFNVFDTRPANRGVQAQGVSTGTFTTQNNGAALSIACLKNAEGGLSSMPNLSQIQALIQAYSPWIYFHPDEKFLPSSVSWFFENGALLYKKGEESKPVAVNPRGSNLPQGGSNDGSYWLDLPTDNSAKERVKKGNLQEAEAYFHVKPMLGATFTDIAIWVFYPFNGAARAKVEFINISLGKIGEHVGDWEHVTLRISNFNGELKRVFFSEHSSGTWRSASELEFKDGNKPVAYSSLHGHAAYPKQGANLQGSGEMGIRNDTAKGKLFMDTGARVLAMAAEYLGPSAVVEPPWLNYAREWGPKIEYNIAEEVKKVEKLLPGKLKRDFENFINRLPSELLGEEGPTGPKMKNNWSGDEKI